METDDLTMEAAFDAAFESAINGGEEAPAEETKFEETPAEEVAAAPAEETKVEETPAEEVKTEPVAPQTFPEIEALKKEIEAIKTKPAEKQEPVAAAPIEADIPEWKAFEKEWPDIAAAIKARDAKLDSQRKEELRSVVEQLIAPVMQQQQLTVQDRFIAEVKAGHPDAFDLLPEVEKWVATQPPHVRVGAEYVLEKGNASEVKALYDDFKKATGRTGSPAFKTAPAVAPVDKEKLDKMAAVTATRSNAATADPEDFDSAFAQAVKTITA